MEAAIDAFAHNLGIDADEEMRAMPPSARFPFDPRRRRVSLILDGDLLVSGAPDAVLPRCLTTGDAGAALEEMTARGRRVIAVTRHTMSTPPALRDPETIERDLELLGLIGLEDPPRQEAREAVAACCADPPDHLYDGYVERGETENWIKDLKRACAADRLSCHGFWANQFRLLLHAAAYWLLDTVRRWLGVCNVPRMQLDTLRLRLIKIGGWVRELTTRVRLHLAISHPGQPLWHLLATRPERS